MNFYKYFLIGMCYLAPAAQSAPLLKWQQVVHGRGFGATRDLALESLQQDLDQSFYTLENQCTSIRGRLEIPVVQQEQVACQLRSVWVCQCEPTVRCVSRN